MTRPEDVGAEVGEGAGRDGGGELDAGIGAALSSGQSTWSTARNASCGISTVPTCFMRRFPSFCFSSSLRFRVMSPP